jgi:predicted naringenin-chalcone synthase
MPEARILGLGRAVPERSYTQRELYALNPWEPSPLIDQLFLASPIQTRNFFVGPDWYTQPRTLTETNAAWLEGALILGEAAVREALGPTAARDLDQFAVTTVTGYATPGLDLLLARSLGMSPRLQRVHFNCIGCHAAIPLLRVTADHVSQRPGTEAVALAVEVCSAAFSNDPDAANLVALSLFADGAAAVRLGTEGEGPALVDFESRFAFEHLDALGFDLTTAGFRIVLDPSIPHVIGAHIRETVEALLHRSGLTVADVGTWCFHPGGARILDAVQQQLCLDDEAMLPSRRVLREHGNMSSPSVLFVLAAALRYAARPAGSFGVLASFGPGLGIEAALIRF